MKKNNSNENNNSNYVDYRVDVNNYLDNNSSAKPPWYKQTWVIILLCLFIFPVGIYLFLKHVKLNKVAKGFLTFIFGIIFIGVIGSLTNDNPSEEPPSPGDTSSLLAESETTYEDTQNTTVANIDEETTPDNVADTTKPPISDTTPAQTTTPTTTPIQTTTPAPTTTPAQPTTLAPTTTPIQTTTPAPVEETTSYTNVVSPSNSDMVWIVNTGKKYHNNPYCSNMNNPFQIPLDEAISMGREPCKKCHK